MDLPTNLRRFIHVSPQSINNLTARFITQAIESFAKIHVILFFSYIEFKYFKFKKNWNFWGVDGWRHCFKQAQIKAFLVHCVIFYW